LTTQGDPAPDRRVALVTGASRGLGRAVALKLADGGTHLILAARTVGGLEETDDLIRQAGGSATLVPMDLSKPELIDQLGGQIFARFGRLDVLIGNAATLGVLSPLGHVDPKVFANVLAVGVSANYRLIRSMDPLLRRSTAGRAVFVTCAAGTDPKPYWGLLATAKAGLEAMVKSWAAELAKTSVRVCLFDPGPMRTTLRAQAFPGEDSLQVPTPDAAAAALASLTVPSSRRHGETVRFENAQPLA
jgi:NAD(P)-dependent dehydrogenase (short-subunit alcohol dehydrogenase family)